MSAVLATPEPVEDRTSGETPTRRPDNRTEKQKELDRIKRDLGPLAPDLDKQTLSKDRATRARQLRALSYDMAKAIFALPPDAKVPPGRVLWGLGLPFVGFKVHFKDAVGIEGGVSFPGLIDPTDHVEFDLTNRRTLYDGKIVVAAYRFRTAKVGLLLTRMTANGIEFLDTKGRVVPGRVRVIGPLVRIERTRWARYSSYADGYGIPFNIERAFKRKTPDKFWDRFAEWLP